MWRLTWRTFGTAEVVKLTVGEVWRIYVPYNDGPFPPGSDTGKWRPGVVIGWSPEVVSSQQPLGAQPVVLVVPITSFGDGGQPRDGDVPVADYQAAGLTKPSWIRARVLFSAHPKAFRGGTGPLGRVSRHELRAIFAEISALVAPN
ncbi:type II toxin-antitoxin system PemK/MazF family toxin [Enemella evansiae]|uniref:type II toxin-antitoxin system PemK/MazF family toxin n=1 Tax=Enemella evansiae TaxID=2016499 RepID=UPI000B971518|nr:hypothetical protein CGZ97_07935 [Enemella evansiae]OYO09802.1 hypothetical protein CGZ98_11740 [Enemella evansiae]